MISHFLCLEYTQDVPEAVLSIASCGYLFCINFKRETITLLIAHFHSSARTLLNFVPFLIILYHCKFTDKYSERCHVNTLIMRTIAALAVWA